MVQFGPVFRRMTLTCILYAGLFAMELYVLMYYY